MRRVLLFCSAVLAACQLPVAAVAAPATSDVPVTPAMAAVAESLGLTPALHRARFASDLVPLIYGSEDRSSLVRAALRPRGSRPEEAPAGDTVLVPVPLSAATWSRLIFHRSVAPESLLDAIVSDRKAALLWYGLAGLDRDTLAFVEEHPALLGDLYEHAPRFGTFASSLHVHQGVVVPPGGASAVPLWEAVVGVSVDRPERFAHALYADNDARIAYLYDIVAELDQPHATFVLGAWIGGESVRVDRFKALAAAVVRGYREWPVDERPFVRPRNDFAIFVTRLALDATGAPAPPASRSFWDDVFQMHVAVPAEAVRGERGLIDAAYLAEASAAADMYVRADRVEQLSFAQRVFGGAPGQDAESAAALKATPHQRMLLLALERMGIRRASVYVAASRAALAATGPDPNRAFWTLAQLQGSLALVVRLRTAGTIDAAAAERLVMSLSAVPVSAGRYDGAIARWFDRELVPVLPPGDTTEARLIAGLSGRAHDPAGPHVFWEGQEYALDFAAANARRLRAVRGKQGGYSIDAALELARLSRRDAAPASSGEERGKAASLAAVAENFPTASRNALVDTMAPGVQTPVPPREQIDRVLGDLRRIDERRDPGRAARATDPLVETADIALSEALLSLVYALDLGDPDGTALLGSNVALRHDFGFALHDSETRERRPWEVPRQEVVPGVPWHVTGSLVGLDIALAPLALKRIELDGPALVPHLRSVEREAFAVDAALIDRRVLRDDDRAVVVGAIARGRARVESISTIDDIDPVADAIRMDGWRRQALAWTLAHDRASVPASFSLIELLVLGGGAPSVDLDAWGMSAHLSAGCLCTRLAAPGGWRLYQGRPQLPFVSFVVSDLNLRVAALLDEMHLPAPLQAPVMAAAVQDLIDEAAPSGADDWLSVAQAAQALTRQRVEDYVAAAAAVDGPLVPLDDPATARAR